MATGKRYSDKLKREIADASRSLGADAAIKKYRVGKSSIERWRRLFPAEAAQPQQAKAKSNHVLLVRIGMLEKENQRMRNLLLDIMLGKRPELVGAIKER